MASTIVHIVTDHLYLLFKCCDRDMSI